VILLAFSAGDAGAQGVPTPSCSLEYDLQADLVPEIPTQAENGDFFEFSWKHFLALNAPSVGGQINPSGDNVTQWAGWSSTADLLNQTDGGPSGTHFYPAACQTIPSYEQYRVIQQVGKVDDSVLEAQTRGLSESPVIDANGKFVRYEILISPAMYNQVVAEMWNEEITLRNLSGDVNFACGDVSYTGGDPASSEMGAIALKLAWRDASEMSTDERARFHTESILVYSPGYRNSTGEDSCELMPMAMVGMHIAHKTLKQPNWIWATFEHADNAPDCEQLPVTPDGSQKPQNTSCPILPAGDPGYSFFSAECDDPGNQSCQTCNTPPRSNDKQLQCQNPYVGQLEGWCLDQPPASVDGLSRLCRQVPAESGHCSDDPRTSCLVDSDCSAGASCDANYPDVAPWNTACLGTIETASMKAEAGPSVWSNYLLIGAQWVAKSYGACVNVARDIAAKADGPVASSILREQLILDVDGSGDPITRPFLGNTSMESYDRANCLGCHAKSYVDGYCFLDNSVSCTTNDDCEPNNGPCQNADTINTDLMYFLKVEVANAPALRLDGTSLTVVDLPGRRHTGRWFRWRAQSPLVVLGEPESSRDPRCNGDPPGTWKARIDLVRADDSGSVATFGLPCDRWRLVGGHGGPPRLEYRDPRGESGPCRSISIAKGREVGASCFSDADELGLVDERAPLHVVLSTGKLRYCATHRGIRRIDGGPFGILWSRDDDPPTSCAAPR